MPRVRVVEMDGMKLCISPLSYDEAETYIVEGRKLLDRDPKPTDEDWARRTHESVVKALNKAAGKEEWTLNGDSDKKNLKKELDIPFINKLYAEFVEMSGLGVKKVGEAAATSTGQ